MKTRKCSKCGIDKPFGDFHKNPGGPHGLSSQCKECRKEYKARNRDKIREKDREYQLKRVYGISKEEHDYLVESQEGICAGCGASSFNQKSYHLAVDHDHETGTIRGLLCLKCNRILGLAQDNPDLLRKLADYLEHGVAEVGSQTLRNKNAQGQDVRPEIGQSWMNCENMAEERRPSIPVVV